MARTPEEFVRRELQSILRGDTYRKRSVCLPCLMSNFVGYSTGRSPGLAP